MKTIKCSLFVFVGYPNSPTCSNSIEISDKYEIACEQLNKAGWRKCGSGSKTTGYPFGRWGYFCPEHADNNQYYQKESK